MGEYSYQKNWFAMSDKALTRHIGEFVKHHRLQRNKTQGEIANNAGISRSTLSLLERGETVTLGTLIRVLRVLDQLRVMEAFSVYVQPSPLLLSEKEHQQRLRARSGKNKNSKESDW